MIKLKSILKGLLFFVVFIPVGSCIYSVIKTKNPVFNKPAVIVENKLRAIVSCDNIDINGKETKTNGKVVSELEVRVINGSNIPTDDAQMKALAKTIARELKNVLKEPADYNTYKILFVIQEINGIVTKSDLKGFVFKAEEL